MSLKSKDSACEVSVSTKNATIVDLIKANKNISKLKLECLFLKIVDAEDLICVPLNVFQMHPLQTLIKVTLLKVVICFCTKRASCFLQLHENQEKLRVVKNTLAAETLALEHALGMFYDQIVYL